MAEFDNYANLLYPNHIKRILQDIGFRDVQLKFITFFPKFLKRFQFFEKYLYKVPTGAHYCFISRKKKD